MKWIKPSGATFVTNDSKATIDYLVSKGFTKEDEMAPPPAAKAGKVKAAKVVPPKG